MGKKLKGLVQQIVDGLMSLKRDRVLQLLIINTLVAYFRRETKVYKEVEALGTHLASLRGS